MMTSQMSKRTIIRHKKMERRQIRSVLVSLAHIKKDTTPIEFHWS